MRSGVVFAAAAVVRLLGTWKNPVKWLASACSLRKDQVQLPRKHVLWHISTQWWYHSIWRLHAMQLKLLERKIRRFSLTKESDGPNSTRWHHHILTTVPRNTGHEEYSLAPFWAKLAYHLWPTCFQFLAEKHPLQCHFAPPLQSFVPPTALAHRSETLLQGNRNRYNSITITDVEDWYFNPCWSSFNNRNVNFNFHRYLAVWCFHVTFLFFLACWTWTPGGFQLLERRPKDLVETTPRLMLLLNLNRYSTRGFQGMSSRLPVENVSEAPRETQFSLKPRKQKLK